jgi:hypothetical protein
LETKIVASPTNQFKEDYYLRAFDLARMGKTDEEMCSIMGVRLHQLRRWVRTKPALAAAINRGRLEARSVLDITDPSQQAIYEEAGVGKIYQIPFEYKELTRAQRAFLMAYAACGKVTEAATAAEVTHSTHHVWLARCPMYKKAFRHAENVITDRIEDAAYRRAVEGVKTKKFHEGREVMEMCGPDDEGAIRFFDENTNRPYYLRPYVELKYSDYLTGLLLKGRRPKRYQQKPLDVKVDASQTTHVHLDLNDVLNGVAKGRGYNVLEADSVHKKAQELIESHRASNATVEDVEATDVE